ncbi:hypothetical protein [Azospirillum halopraeferens]|uniref:hypothetical protein n=1 Tax=Azospirillum halopraeferens TaxID=34010 RepID=UPI0004104A57|nr:hypothetical protein [Azospirillum halopraeferens]
MSPLEMFATGLAVISAAALGVSLILTTVRTASQARRLSALRQVVQARTDEIEAMRRRIAGVERLTRTRQGECGELETRRVRTDAATRAAAADKIELVHELGAVHPGYERYRCDLRTAPDFARVETRRLVFAREIWERRNVAIVRAPDAESAMITLNRVFPPASGVLAGSLRPDPEAVAGGPRSGADEAAARP